MKSSELKVFGCILVVIGVMVGFVLWATNQSNKAMGTPPPPTPKFEVTKSFLQKTGEGKGDPNKALWLVEFGDYQCASCMAASLLVDANWEMLEKKVYFVFNHFRANEQHFNAPLMAQAAKAAGKQGKYWEMHKELYTRQTEFGGKEAPEVLSMCMNMAKKLKLDLLSFQPALTDKKVEEAVVAEQDAAVKTGVELTPSFYLYRFEGDKAILVKSFAGKDPFEAWLKDPVELK